jgi:diguanylate cyclase (GGDEF)-like protein
MNPSEAKVLVVDDDPSMLRIYSKWLEKEVRSICTASDGEQALRAIEIDCPDFILTDWEMPWMDGLALCRAVRRIPLPHYVYVFFVTAKSSQEEIIAGLEAGADDFLTKPVHHGELLARLRAGSRVLELERRLSLLASTDPLTSALTQRSFYETLEKEWARSKRFRLPLSCVMLDLDYFKRINDVHGHPAGDAMLKTVAELLAKSSRQSDTVCRYGGEEFCILLPETNEQEAARWAERLRVNLAQRVVSMGGKELRITGSFGVAQRYDDTQNAEQLIDLADQALLTAKRAGRDRVVRFAQLADADGHDLAAMNSQESLFCGITARHVMSPMVACVRDNETIGQAAEFFLRARINSTPVVDAAGMLVGMLSEKDLMAAMVSVDCWTQPVSSVMKPNVICYEEDTPIRVIYEFLCRVSIRRVVVAVDGRPTGTISRGTLLRWFRNLVISKGLLQDSETWQVSDVDPYRSRQRLADTARELATQATRLAGFVQQNVDDLVPYVVGGATGMQELVTDLLAYSRYANQGGAGAVESLALEGSHMD